MIPNRNLDLAAEVLLNVADVAQLVEASDLKSLKCGFESRRRHHLFLGYNYAPEVHSGIDFTGWLACLTR